MGWGQVGQHRKSGGHGGVGNAGLHKHKWSWVLVYDPDHFGKHGFHRPGSEEVKRWANVEDIEQILEKYQPKEFRENLPVLDLRELGIEKLLGRGKLSKPLYIIVDKWTKKAEEAVKAVGGKIASN